MWQPTNAHYVYGRKNSHTTVTVGIRYATLITGVIVLILAAFGLGRVSTAAPQDANYELPAVALPATQLSELKAPPIINEEVVARDIDAFLKDKKIDKQLSIHVKSLTDDSEVSVGDTHEYNPASLYKLMLLPVLFDRYDWDDFKKVQVNNQELGSCVDAMLVRSDNCSEDVVKQLFGWQAIEQKMTALGYPSLRINDQGGMSINAAEFNRFIGDLYNGNILTEQQRQYVFKNLSQQVYNRGIPAGCTDCKVMNKTGDNGVRHDSAILEADGNVYAITILTDGLSYAEIAELTKITMQSVRSSQWITL